MPTALLACPSEYVLGQLARLELPADEADPLYDHLEGCDSCQSVFAELTADQESQACSPKAITKTDLEKARTAIESEELKAIALVVWNRFNRSDADSPAEPALTVPCRLRQYDILRLIDQGGMGEVYEGRHTHLKRPVAVKVIRGVRRENPAAQESFLREMETAGQLEHPNLVRAYDAWEQDGCLFLAQELLDGESLHTCAKRGKIQRPVEVLSAFLGICRALEKLHGRKLLHRDVTPANVMRLEDGTIKLIDYGLAVALDAGLSAKAKRAGTEGFMAPEQQYGKASDQRSDIYAAGRVLEFLLNSLPVSTRHGDLYDSLAALAKDCTQEDPERRPQSVYSIIVRLEDLQKQTAQRRDASLTNTLQTTDSLGKGRKGLIFLGFGLLLASSLFAPQLFRIPTTTKPAGTTTATVMIQDSEAGDILNVVGPDGTTRALQLDGSSTFPLRPGVYQFSLAGIADRHVSPSVLTLSSEAEETLRVVQGPGDTSAGIDGDSQDTPLVIQSPIEIAMTDIPAGRFLMGASDGDELAGPDELPQREVVFEQPFRISTYEITVGQFRKFVEGTGYVTTAEAQDGGWIASRSSSWGTHDPSLSWENPGYPLAETLPVTVVTYEDAQQFCEWLSQRNGSRYRLPTEAEWEYACRAGTTGPYHFAYEARDAYCWSLWNAKDTVRPRPVGTRQPNPWGLFDINGNVREWCLDWYAEDAYATLYIDAPEGPPTGTLRVIRGGCFIDLDSFMRSSRRGYLKTDQIHNNQGFRVVELVAE
jgi:formylglycine-generating enzyme required for sulfatase activity